MAKEKSLSLYLEKVPFENENPKAKFCSKSTLSWILISFLLLILLIVVSFEFLFERQLGHDYIQIIEEPIDQVEVTPPMMTDYVDEAIIKVKVTPPTMTDYVDEDVNKKPKKKPWNVEFLIDPIHLCATRTPPDSEQYQQDPEVKLLMLVHSAVNHFTQRMAIRNTWGSIAEKPFGPMRLGFVLGTTDNKTESDCIMEESSKYKDIIQADFEDTYLQQTTKSILMLKWVAGRCPHAEYFLKTEDDTFVNVAIIANILGSEPFVSKDKFIGGHILRDDAPSRIPNKKYYVPEDVYPYKKYPSYASGSAYVTTGPTAVELFLASSEVLPFLPVEDVFVTGLCAQQINAALLHDSRFIHRNPPSPPSWQAFSSVASAHSVTPDILDLVWEDMTRSIFEHLFKLEADINATALIRRQRLPSMMLESLYDYK